MRKKCSRFEINIKLPLPLFCCIASLSSCSPPPCPYMTQTPLPHRSHSNTSSLQSLAWSPKPFLPPLLAVPLKTNRFLAGFVVIRLIFYPAVQHLKGLCLVTWVSPEALSTEPAQSKLNTLLLRGPFSGKGKKDRLVCFLRSFLERLGSELACGEGAGCMCVAVISAVSTWGPGWLIARVKTLPLTMWLGKLLLRLGDLHFNVGVMVLLTSCVIVRNKWYIICAWYIIRFTLSFIIIIVCVHAASRKCTRTFWGKWWSCSKSLQHKMGSWSSGSSSLTLLR